MRKICPCCGQAIAQTLTEQKAVYHRSLSAVCRAAKDHFRKCEALTFTEVLSHDPKRRATSDELWLYAARLRRFAVYSSVHLLGLRQAEAARAAGLSKAAVCLMLQSIDKELDRPKIQQFYKDVERRLSA